jgi:hypothetical protein
MSLPCCPTQYTCSPNPSVCNVTSGNIRSAYNVAGFSSRGVCPHAVPYCIFVTSCRHVV